MDDVRVMSMWMRGRHKTYRAARIDCFYEVRSVLKSYGNFIGYVSIIVYAFE